MMQTGRRNLVGNIVNGWELLEEINLDFPDEWSCQRKHNARRFRAKHQVTGVELTSSISCIRNKRDGKNHRRKSKEFQVNQIVGSFEILRIVRPMKQYEVRDVRTNEISSKSRANLLYHIRYIKKLDSKFHFARSRDAQFEDRQIYSLWQNTKQACFNPNHRQYEHYGARGLTMCDEWSNDFKTFRSDIINEIGYKPSSTSMIWIIDGLIYKPGNVKWIKRKRMNTRNSEL